MIDQSYSEHEQTVRFPKWDEQANQTRFKSNRLDNAYRVISRDGDFKKIQKNRIYYQKLGNNRNWILENLAKQK